MFPLFFLVPARRNLTVAIAGIGVVVLMILVVILVRGTFTSSAICIISIRLVFLLTFIFRWLVHTVVACYTALVFTLSLTCFKNVTFEAPLDFAIFMSF